MGESAIRSEDIVGLVVAVTLHALLALMLVIQMFFAPDPFVPPERVAVSLASEVSLEATAPSPLEESRAAVAPELTDLPEAPAEEASEPAEVEQQTAPPPPAPNSARRTVREPAPDRNRSRPDRRPQRPAQPAKQAGGSRIGDNFLEGRGTATNTDATEAPAPTFGRRERAALASAITRQLRPHWNAPAGVEAELLESVVTWSLNPDGSLAGRPRCRNIASSVTPSNRPQAALHCERAIRAVQLAAPFNLPEQFYNRWKDLEWEFNRRL